MQVMLDDKRLLKAFYITRVGCFLPLCTLYGGFMAQEVIKALSGKFSPLKQWVSSFTLLLLLTMLLFKFFWGKFISWILVPNICLTIIPVLKLMCGLRSQTRYVTWLPSTEPRYAHSTCDNICQCLLLRLSYMQGLGRLIHDQKQGNSLKEILFKLNQWKIFLAWLLVDSFVFQRNWAVSSLNN
mgnify:FL=1